MTFKEYLVSIKDKRVAVIGAGISNTPLIEALQEAGIETTVRDQKQGSDYLDNLTEDIIFRTPSLMPTNPALVEAVSRGAVLTSEMELFFDLCPCKIIGVTGSDGKTTTTSIIAELLKNEGRTVHLGGNIGRPLLRTADSMDKDDIAVVELSSFQLISMKKSPHIAVVTNLSPNHLDIHADMVEYIEAKSNIFAHQGEGDRAVFNLDNEVTRRYAAVAQADEILMFSRRKKVLDGIFLEDDHIFESKNGVINVIMPSDDIILPGIHNVENFMAAFAAVQGLVSISAMSKTARTFKGVAHRIELVRELHGVKYFNDSIASSPSRAVAGLRSFEPYKQDGRRNVILIAGGKDKDMSFDELGSVVLRYVKTLVLTGLTAEKIRDAVINAPGYIEPGNPGCEGSPEIVMCDDFENAVITASKAAQLGDIVLLSPASTSFDRFKNFEERGNLFKQIVNELV